MSALPNPVVNSYETSVDFTEEWEHLKGIVNEAIVIMGSERFLKWMRDSDTLISSVSAIRALGAGKAFLDEIQDQFDEIDGIN